VRVPRKFRFNHKLVSLDSSVILEPVSKIKIKH